MIAWEEAVRLRRKRNRAWHLARLFAEGEELDYSTLARSNLAKLAYDGGVHMYVWGVGHCNVRALVPLTRRGQIRLEARSRKRQRGWA